MFADSRQLSVPISRYCHQRNDPTVRQYLACSSHFEKDRLFSFQLPGCPWNEHGPSEIIHAAHVDDSALATGAALCHNRRSRRLSVLLESCLFERLRLQELGSDLGALVLLAPLCERPLRRGELSVSQSRVALTGSLARIELQQSGVLCVCVYCWAQRGQIHRQDRGNCPGHMGNRKITHQFGREKHGHQANRLNLRLMLTGTTNRKTSSRV